MRLGEIIKTLKRIYCKHLCLDSSALYMTQNQVVPLEFSMSTSQSKNSVIGFVSALRCRNLGTTPWKKKE
jgi:hypothetical protein